MRKCEEIKLIVKFDGEIYSVTAVKDNLDDLSSIVDHLSEILLSTITNNHDMIKKKL